jgi:hypothetical protein
MKTIKNPIFDNPEEDVPEEFAAISETTSADETLEEVNRLLEQFGLEVVIHEPTIPVPVVNWGFTIEKTPTTGGS